MNLKLYLFSSHQPSTIMEMYSLGSWCARVYRLRGSEKLKMHLLGAVRLADIINHPYKS